MNIKLLWCRSIAVFISVCCCLFCCPVSASVAETENGSMFDEIFNSSIVLYGGSPYYYQNGNKMYFDKSNTAYAPPYADGIVMIPSDMLSNLLGFTITYDKSTEVITGVRGSKSFTARLEEDALYVDGEEKYMPAAATYNGTKTFLSLIDIAKALGYYTYADGNGLFIVTTHSAFSDDFTASVDNLDEVYNTDIFVRDFTGVTERDVNLSYNVWSLHDWGEANGDVRGKCGYRKDDTYPYTMFADAVPSDFAGGLCSGKFEFDKNNLAYRFRYRVKTSEDYEGNQPAIVFLYYYNSVYVTSKFVDIEDYSSEQWTDGEYLLKQEDFPTELVNGVNVALVTKYDNVSDAPTGQCYFSYSALSAYGTENKDKILCADLMKDYFIDAEVYNDFETGELGKGWAYYDWGSGKRPSAEYNISDGDAFSGNFSVALNAVPSSFAGILSPMNVVTNERSFEVRFRYKRSADCENNTPFVMLQFYNSEGQYLQMRSLAIPTTNTSEWEEAVAFLDTDNLKKQISFGSDRFILVVGTKYNGINGAPASGQILFDDIRLINYDPLNNGIVATFDSEKFGSWYILGNDVVLTCKQPERISAATSVTGYVYDSQNNLVTKSTQKIASVYENGWRWKPNDTGWYKIYLYADMIDGTQKPIVSFKNGVYKDVRQDFTIKEHSVAVVKGETKPVSERNEKLYFSDPCRSEVGPHLASLVGFYGARIHYIAWGEPAGGLIKGSNNKQGEYDWTTIDKQFGYLDKYGFGGIIPNFFGTPKWAVAPEYQEMPGNTIAGMWVYNCYPPENMQYLTDYCTEIVNRYKDRNIRMWEFWNEPQMGKTAFWYGTPEEYAEMQKTAYTAIKAVDPNALVTMGAQGTNFAYYSFFEQLMQNPDYYNYFDVLPLHGRYFPNSAYNAMYKKYGYEPKPWLNSEGYFTQLYTRGERLDQRKEALYFTLCILSHYKANATAITHFAMADTELDDERLFNESLGGSTINYCLFSDASGEPLPKLSAVAAHNLFEAIPKNCEYVGEYALSDGQKAVSMKSGDDAIMILWNSDGLNFSLDEKIRAMMTNDTVITDFEGKETDVDNMLPETIYIITGIDAKQLETVESDENTCLNEDFISPYYTCRTSVPVAEIDDSIPRINNSAEKPFNEENFAVSNDIEWHDNDYTWVGSSNSDKQPNGFSARHSVHIDEDGLYLLIDVKDSSLNYPLIGDVAGMWQFDSVQLAVDTKNNGKGDDRMEVQIGKRPDGDVIYKQTSPFVGSDLPQEWTTSGNPMQYGKLQIEETADGAMYKIFIPMSELYPYVYPGSNDYVRMSFIINANDGNGRAGYLEWSSGIGASKNSSEYGILSYSLDDK